MLPRASNNKENLREKLSQLRHARMSRQTALNRLKKQTKADEEDQNITHLLDMYQSFVRRGMTVLHPSEALSDADKYTPIVEQLTKTFAPNHPLTAYYQKISSLFVPKNVNNDEKKND
jgi:hypothetical protein